ncbi:Innexin, partial [Caligus rogercresseyi]
DIQGARTLQIPHQHTRLHNSWYLKIMLANFIYLFNVIGQNSFTDCFLGYEFSKYGIRAASFLGINPERRVDPMSRVFPRMTKCTFLKYGPSGSLQKHDAQCLLPINIINEKIYVFLWFWFGLLAVLTALDIVWKLTLLLSTRSRRSIIKRKLRLSPNRDKLDVDVNLIADFLTASDWKLLYHLLRNMDSLYLGSLLSTLRMTFGSTIRKAVAPTVCPLNLSCPRKMKNP